MKHINEPIQAGGASRFILSKNVVAKTGLLIVFFTMPFGNAISLFDGRVSGNRIAGFLLVITYLIYGVRLKSFDAGRYRVTTPLIYLFGWSILALIWCPYDEHSDALVAIFRLAQIVIQLHIIYEYFQNKQNLKIAGLAYLAGIICIAGSAAVGISSWTASEYGGRLAIRIYGGEQNANELANQVTVGLLILGFSFGALKKRERALAVGAVILLVWIVLASGSRGAIIAGMASAMVVFIWPTTGTKFLSKRKYTAVKLSLVAIIAVIFIAGGYISTNLDEQVAKRFDTKRIFDDLRTDRLASIEAGFRYVFAEGFWLGAGRIGGCQVQTRSGAEDVVHSMPVAWMADLGLPTIIIYIFLIWRILRLVHRMPPGQIRWFCLSLSVFVLLVAAKGGGTGYSPWMWLMLGVITAIAYGESFGWQTQITAKAGVRRTISNR